MARTSAATRSALVTATGCIGLSRRVRTVACQLLCRLSPGCPPDPGIPTGTISIHSGLTVVLAHRQPVGVCWSGRVGRLKIRRGQPRASSTLASGTLQHNVLASASSDTPQGFHIRLCSGCAPRQHLTRRTGRRCRDLGGAPGARPRTGSTTHADPASSYFTLPRPTVPDPCHGRERGLLCR
jgi:hypothetical protein